MRYAARLIDPVSRVNLIAEEESGVVLPRHLTPRIDAAERFFGDDDSALVIIQETLYWYRENIGTSGDTPTGYLMRVGGQSSATAWSSYTLPITVPGQGRLLAARFHCSEACTAGLARLAINVIEDGETDLWPLEDCEIDATNTRQACTRFDWPVAKQFSSAATIEARVVTENGFAPTTADFTAALTFGYQTWAG